MGRLELRTHSRLAVVAGWLCQGCTAGCRCVGRFGCPLLSPGCQGEQFLRVLERAQFIFPQRHPCSFASGGPAPLRLWLRKRCILSHLSSPRGPADLQARLQTVFGAVIAWIALRFEPPEYSAVFVFFHGQAFRAFPPPPPPFTRSVRLP